MDIYDRINLLIKEQHLTRKSLCEKSNISYNTLTAMFARRSTNIDVRTIKKIADCLNTTLEYLVSGNEEYKYLAFENNDFTVIAIKNKNTKRSFILSEEDFNTIVTLLEKFKRG